MARAEITIDLVAFDDFVDARDFETVLKETLESLDSLASSAEPNRRAKPTWRITAASLHSPLHVTLTEDPKTQETERSQIAVRAFVAGLRQLDLEEHPTEPPALFNATTLRSAKRLVEILKRKTLSKMTISSPEAGEIVPTFRVAINVEELIGIKFRAFGALEGILETLSVKGQTQFKIFDSLTNDRIVCFISPERLEQAKAALQVPPNRVLVYGEIHYAKSGKPLSIKVEQTRILRPQGELPQAKDLEGIDLTGGVDPTDYIRGLRDDD